MSKPWLSTHADCDSIVYACISDQILILGNGGIKNTRTYQEDEELSGYVMDLQTFDRVLVKAQKSGKVTIEKNMITDIQSATFEI